MCSDAAIRPGLGNPREFISDLDCLILRILGLAFPYLGSLVIVPPVTNPNPRLDMESNMTHFLSYPAANPTGFFRGIPPTLVSRAGCS